MRNCRNCSTPLQGAFCLECGQKDDDYRRPLLALSNEFLGDVFQWDSRVFRSVLPFLFMPGNLTRAYMRGRRQQFVSPLRLYLVMSIVFFIALGLSDRAIFGFTLSDPRNLVEDFPNIADELADVDPQYLNYGTYVQVAMFVDPDAMTAIPSIPIDDMEELLGESGLGETLTPLFLGYNAAVADPRIFNRVLDEWVPRLMVILVPFFALIMGALFVRRRVYFFDHLVFSLHFHSFIFAVLLMMLAASSWFGLAIKGPAIASVFLGLIALYLYIAMVRTYRGGLIKTAFKFLILTNVYANVFLVSLFVITAYGLSKLNTLPG